MMGRSLRLRGETAAQATVEMAVVLPVMIALALIVYNLMMFSAAVARFDRVAPDIVIAQGVAPAGDGLDGGVGAACLEDVKRGLEAAMEGCAVEIEVSVEGGAEKRRDGGAMLGLVGEMRTYRCVMRYRPWPRLDGFAGVRMLTPEALAHERTVTVDPWRPGVIV